MASVEYDLTYLREGLAVLQDYLLSNDLYWTIHASPPAGTPPFPSLTPGGMVLAHHCLAGRSLTGNKVADFSSLDEEFRRLRDHWRTAWERKVARDLRARLNQWRNFLEDYRQDSANNADRFGYEIRLRVMIDLLVVEAPAEQKETEEALLALDGILLVKLIPGNFVWERELERAFPSKPFWYLYGRLKE